MIVNEKAVESRMAGIPGIIEYLSGKADEALNDAKEAVLSGQQIKAIQSASLAEYFQNLKADLEEMIKSNQ